MPTRPGARRLLGAAVGVAFALISATLQPDPARAAVPLNALALGTYPVSGYSFGKAVSGTLQVTDSGAYRQITRIGTQRIDITLEQSANAASPFYIDVVDIYLNGLLFVPVGVDQPTYRPYRADNLLSPGSTWSWDAYSSGGGSGGVSMDVASVVALAPVRMGNDVVQRMDTTLTLWGPNASGTITIAHFEVIGNRKKSRDIFWGSYTWGGTTYYIDATIRLGGL